MALTTFGRFKPAPSLSFYSTLFTKNLIRIQSSLKPSFPIKLKAYTEALVSWDTKDKSGREITIRGFIDYGISYAQSTPESLETFFAIAETKASGLLNDDSWAQLWSYMGWYLSCAMVLY